MTIDSGAQVTRRLLLVEDNFLIGIDLKARLERLGYEVDGPLPSFKRARLAIEAHAYDIAVLDMNIADGTAVPVAELLQQRDCPFVFLTGYASVVDLPDSMRSTRKLVKPLDDTALERALTEALEARPRA